MSFPNLKTVLLANASFSTLCGISLLAAPSYIAQLLGSAPNWVCLPLGISLLIFAVDVLFIARGIPRTTQRARIIFFADVVWVLLTPVVMLIFSSFLNTIGKIVLIDIAIIVAIFAWLEWSGLRKLKQPIMSS